MNEHIKIAILKILSESEGPWHWLKLDRALSAREPGGHSNVVEVANELSNESLLEITASGNPAMPTYTITAKGRKWLANFM